MTGGSGNDTFNVDSGTDTITDLTTGDILVVSSGATANATNISAFVATSSTSNSGTTNLTTANGGGTIDVGNSTTGAYSLTGLAGADTLKGNGNIDIINGGSGNDTIDGRGGNDHINAGDGDDTIIISSAGDGNGDTIDGGNGTNTLQLSAGSHTFSNDASIQNVQTIVLNASGSTINLTGQTEGLTITGGASNDIITAGSGVDIINGAGGADTITGANGSDIISLGNSDSSVDTVVFDEASGMDTIKEFTAGASGDIMKYTHTLQDSESSQNIAIGSDNTDEILSVDFIIGSLHSSTDITQLVIGFTTAVTQNGLTSGSSIDFTGIGVSSSQIVGAIEMSLENTNAGSGNGLLSGVSGTQVIQGDINETKLLLFTDGGSGSAEDVAIIRYSEGSTSETDFSGELTLTSVLQSVDISTLTHENFFG